MGFATLNPSALLRADPRRHASRRQGGFLVNNNESTSRKPWQGPASMQERGPAVLPTKGPPEAAHVFSLICDAMARDMPLSYKRPTLWAPGAIPTMDFLLHHVAVVVKKT